MSVAAVVLAAGGSRRMGRPKQLLTIDGESLLRRTVDVALKVGCDPVIVVLGASRAQLQEDLSDLPLKVVDNPDWEKGPGTSVQTGILNVGKAEAALFLVCDQPFVDAAHLLRLIDAWRQSGLPMAASAYADTIGVPAIFDASCFAQLRSLPPGAGAKKLLLSRRDHVALVSFPAGAVDLDTPAEAESVCRRDATD